ncbi:MAG: ABC transporter ATP-binding protein [Caldilinea sp.]|uniref:ABC transporter ATP-binding protein n=1 Tax=Caldilinea sp. TaxID=2293560 RepID=UPI002B9A3226|nr:ABC transporter ATP-binding protein [Anaerolineales bacterium]HQY92953.1 ABC transporter ATP-binding protein [Caldilinea sp.]HRA66176.1 ABC transporter ATP-binding protein [Caldilinea sp.]
MIEFVDLTKRYGKFTAVDHLTLHVPAQGAVALWGVNGAGKTTVIKCLLGLLRFDGQITVDGCDVRRQGRAARQRIGYVPQELAFYKEMTTFDMAEFYARLRGAPRTHIAPVLEQVGLAEHQAKPVGALSGGMKQRLALGLALLADPPVLVMDEPTSNLDTAARSQLLQLLTQVKQAGKTIVFTSHRIEEVETLADEVAVMEQGQLQFTCPSSALAQRIGLRTQVKFVVPGDQLDHALAILRDDGLAVRRNGIGVIVDVAHGEKARPIHVLGRADIEVIDFEME